MRATPLRLSAVLAVWLVLAPLGLAAGDARTPQPAILIANPGHCIAPVDEMRRNHPDMLRHQRTIAVHDGVRGARVSLGTCIQCHATRAGGPGKDGSGNFCQGCHQYVAVRLDCFECHQSSPVPGTSVASTGELP